MNNDPIIVETIVDAKPNEVWLALTDKEEMKKWYFELDEFIPEEGFSFEFEGGNEHKTFVHVCKILKVIPKEKLSHTWEYKGYQGVSIVTWQLFDQGDTTRVMLTHEGVENFPSDTTDFARNNFVEGWTHIVGSSLKNLFNGRHTE